MTHDIILSVDYHDQICVIRRLCRASGREEVASVPTEPQALRQFVAEAQRLAGSGGRVVWVQESTTGWARVQALLGDQVDFRLANVLQMPRPPKAHRRKTDKVDTARMQREYLAGSLPWAHQPPAAWRQLRRLEAIRGGGGVAAVSIVARVGPVERFRNAEHLIAFAGLAPGVQQSNQTRREGRIGGGGTDCHLRHYLIEASVWARHLPRYRPAYERVARRRGQKIGRLVVARMLLRSMYKVLKDGVAFTPGGAAALG